METLEQRKEFQLNDILQSFFSEDDLREFISKFLFQKEDELYRKIEINSLNRKQIDFQLLKGSSIKIQMDLLVTFAGSKLKEQKYLDLLLNLGHYLITSGELESAYDIFERIINQTKSKQFAGIKADSILALGEIASRQAKWRASINFIRKAVLLYNELKDQKGLAKCENLLGTIYGDMGNIKKAHSHFEKALKYIEEDQDYTLLGMIEINLGIINILQENFDKALSYFEKSLLNFTKTRDLKRIADIRYNMGMTYLKKKEYQTAISEFDQSIAISIEIGYLNILGLGYLSKSAAYIKLCNFGHSALFADKAMEVCYKINDRLSIADIYKIKGIIQRNLSRYDVAENYLLTSLRMNKEFENRMNIAETSFELGLLYKDLGKIKESNSFFNGAISYYKKIKAEQELTEIRRYVS